MKKGLLRQILAFVLVLAMLLPSLADVVALSASAETTTYGEANVYDIFDLTGSETNTIKGTNDTWDGVVIGSVSAEHKENIVFKTKLTMGEQQIRLALNSLEGNSIYDPQGYAVYINHNSGAPYIAIKRNQSDLVVGSIDSVAGTWELEIGIVDILTDGVRTGKHLYVKKDGVTVCEVDDTSGYLTGDSLGTKIVDFHYGASIQMDTAKTSDNTYGTANVYDIFDLTGSETNTVKGTNDTWNGVVIGSVSAEHKENMAFKTELTMGAQQVRLSLNAKDGANIYDPPGYAVYLYGETNRVEIRRNNATLKDATVQGVAGTYIFEVGIVDILQGETVVGKHLYVKMNDVVVCEYDDMDGYLTGDSLGTKIVDFHYGAAIQMDSTKDAETTEPETEPETEPLVFADATVYDISDLTGSKTNTVDGTGNGNWSATVLGNFDAEHKESAALKAVFTTGGSKEAWDNIRLSLGAKESDDLIDPKGYALVISVDENGVSYIHFKRAGSGLVTYTLGEDTVPSSAQLNNVTLEFGYRSILSGETIVGKQLYLAVNGEETYTYDDTDGFLTGDSLGTKVGIFHYLNVVTMDTAKTSDNTYGTATVYDIYDLTGAETNTVNGTDATWDGVVLGNVDAAHKENMAFKTELTMGAQQVRLSLNAKDGASIYDHPGYAVYLYGDTNRVEIRRNNATLKDATVEGVAGTYVFEVGIVDILQGETRVGKHLYVKMNDVVVCEYDDMDGYLTGDALGTKLIDFHYGAAIQMNSTKVFEPETTEPETTEPETTEPETEPLVYADATVYDIYDLTGAVANTIKGTDETWDGQIHQSVSEEHKENMAFKTKLTMGAQQVRLSLNALDDSSIYDPSGYAVYLYGDTNRVEIRRNNATLKDATVEGVAGTYIFEVGIVDILQGETRVGKHLYVKMNDVVVCEYDDMDGYLTGDSLGTKIVDFHYGAAIQMDSTKEFEPETTEPETEPETTEPETEPETTQPETTEPETTEPETEPLVYADATVYDIYDLTGSETNIVTGTGNDNWSGVTLGSVSTAHKENIAFKTKLTMGAQEIRLSLNAKEGADIYDPPGYAVYINHNGGAPYISIRRNNRDLVVGSLDAVQGTWELEIGMVDILEGENRVGKHLYVKKDGVTVCEVDDTNGYLTGDALGIKLVDFHYGAAIQMDTTKQIEDETTEPETTEPETTEPGDSNGYGIANVYDIYDLTGSKTNTVNGTSATWEGVVLGNVDAAHKENMAFKTMLTMGAQEVRLSLNAQDGLTQEQIWDAPGYAVYLHGASNLVQIRRNNAILTEATVDGVAGTYILEAGIVDILQGETIVGKHLYVKMNDVVVCEYDDMDGYLTGDALGTRIIDFHYGAAIQMDTTKQIEDETTEPETTEPETTEPGDSNGYGTANVYDIYDLTGSETNTVTGTGNDNWSGVTLGSVSTAHKENIAFKTKLTMGAQEIRLSLNAKEGADIYDPPGYAVYINHNGGAPYISIRRNNQDLVVGSVDAVQGTWELEIGMVDILQGGVRTGKYLYVKKDGVTVCEVEDTNGYLTGDSLGTKLVDFHYGAAIQMDTTKQIEDETTEPETTEPIGGNGYGTANVYDIYDLTGAETNTITGTGNDNWSGVILGAVSVAHKENIAFKTMLTMGAQEIRLSLNAKEGADIYDPPGYAVYINHNGGAPYIAIRRNNRDLVVGSVDAVQGTWELEIGMVDILQGGVRTGKYLYVKKDGVTVCEVEDTNGYLTGNALGTKLIDFHYGAAIQMDSTKEIETTEPETTQPVTGPQTVADATVYDLYALMGASELTVPGQLQGFWGTTLGHVSQNHKTNVAFATDMLVDEPQTILLGMGLGDMSMAVQLSSGYVLEIVNKTGDGELDTVKIHRAGTQIYCVDQNVDFHGEHAFEYGMVDILVGSTVVGKRIYVKLDGAEVFHYDDKAGFLTEAQTGTKVEIYASGNDLKLGASRNLAAGQATVYDLYDMQGTEHLTLVGRESDPDKWGTTLGNILEEHKENMAFRTTVTMDEAQTIMLGLGLADQSMAVQLSSGYVLEIVMKTGAGEVDTVKIHRAGTQIYCKDQSSEFNGEYELEFGVVDLYDLDADDAVVGKRIYVKINGEEILYYDDTVNALSGDDLGTKVDAYVSGKKLQMTSLRGYQASDAAVYDLYDLAFRETLEVNHTDDGGNVIWGVLIGNVEDAHKGNVALKTKVDMSKDQQQNLLIGLGLGGHWPVSGGLGYQIELNANPDNERDSLLIYKNANPDGGEPVCCYNAEQDFDFNGSFQLEVGVVDLLDSEKKVVARRIYVIINGEELMRYDDTRDVVSGDSMGTVVAAYVSSGTATLGTCVEDIPSANVKVYDIYDLLGRASVKLNRTDAGGAVIWSNMLGEVTDTNNLNYALRVSVDTSKVDRSTMQELILGLCKDTDLFDKMGYRLSLYFGTDGGTSLVLRDSAADQVLASANGVFPTSYSLEIGITDFYGSNKQLIGKKIYLKIDGEEVLSYLDKETDRARGNLLCAYTTTPVVLTTNDSYTTIPVTYVVNGKTVETSKYITSNTDVVVGKKSVIDITLGNQDEFTSVLMKQVLLNGQPITPVSDKQDVYVFELENPSKDDELTVEIQVRNLTVDEAEVYDLYELTGKNKIVISANSVNQIGTLLADGQEGLLNRAIRFAYYIPATGGGLRLGYGSDTSDIWSRTGTHIELWCGFATISHGFHVSALSTGFTDIFKADSWSIVEVGIVKCYEDGVYKYDRWYVKAGKTLEELELITYYDSTQRHDSSLNIMARTPDTGDDIILASTLDVRQVTDVSEETAKAEASVAFKPLFLKGESVKIVVFPKEGKTLESLYVNGEKVEAALTSDGGYVYVMENVTEDVQFSYILSDDAQLYSITADDAANLKVTLDQTSVVAGSVVTVQIKVDGGYTLKSLTVNGVDFLPMARYDKTTLTYTLTISDIRENKHIQAQAEKLSQDGPVADVVAEDQNETNLPVILAVAVLTVAVLGGVVITAVTRARKKGQKQ